MGKINVEGLGVVEIEGDVPTLEEQQTIKENYNRITTEQAAAKRVDSTIEPWTTGQVTRFALEAGFGIGASILTGGLALPALAARGGMLALPFARQLGISTLASAAGSGGGASPGSTSVRRADPVPPRRGSRRVARSASRPPRCCRP